MAEFAPPAGPPPPEVPEGWKAVWNEQYSEWFYVNVYTKKSQWEIPTQPIYPLGEAPPDGPPPYIPSTSGASPRTSTDKKNFGSNNPYGGPSPNSQISEDERLARQLQEEEDARARGDSANAGSASDFYNQGPAPQPNRYASGAGGAYGQSSSPFPHSPGPYVGDGVQDQGKKKKGLFSSLLGGTSTKPAYQQQGYPPLQGGYGYGGQPGGGYYGAPQPGYYPQQQGMFGRPHKKPGMGAGGAAALGVGGGLLGGAMLGSALADAGDHGDTYIENNDYGDDGGDFGDGGGDFGGDGGGGDFGGGDF
ncbi:hypothetical protein CC80DRAFT_488483 [Byssothecium circinans]|uniref:WW domain-containing protein n=1 Tax=Byssothecium circinans TaxID=147558 RepID=A0A6A5UE08_9PLEO|nr:hypothetical protein CC80DRAFT_488483 [Byssothecium circinans]